eukprot:TRINITY_DN4725_c0_g2_i2.p1 TRINITY_DN4725_c0_g2~~TRINITY_DN4725_c0_g2_i2.p1  ORF type:complete len:416 (+),score=112.19 TRINITY_DN4725_c0_g2_i2:79-1326(+)
MCIRDRLEELIQSSPSLFISMRTYKSTKPPTKIKIIHGDFTHLAHHPINNALYYLNQFASAVSKTKDPNTFNKKLVIALLKKLNISLPVQKSEIEHQLLKSKEMMHELKEKLLKHLYSVVNKENEYENKFRDGHLKFSVMAANNGYMVKSVLRQRWWWTCSTKKEDDINFYWTDVCCPSFIQSLPCKESASDSTMMHNHLEFYYNLSNKKELFVTMKLYYETLRENPFDTLPFTFHIKEGTEDKEFQKFVDHFNEIASGKRENIWIIKPGENSNRGNGIQLSKNIEEIKKIIEPSNKTGRTYIIQKYIENPLLINKRKFDIRMFGLMTSVNGWIKGYFYESGYIRTSSKEFTLKSLGNKAVHLTNDAVQQQTEDYGKYEPGNKLTFSEFQTFLDLYHPALHVDFYRDLLPQMKVS